MNLRDWLAPLLALLALGSAACARSSGPPRHLILISLDTARADHFGFLGSTLARTPHLDALARESIVFTDYSTVVPTTLASHASLFTGNYPARHGVPRNGFVLHDDNVTLPELLHAAGFRTAGVIGSFALSSRFGIAQGFEHYDEELDLLAQPGGADQNQRSAAAVTDAAIRALDEEGSTERLFLFVHYFDPHFPYLAPPPFDTAYDPEGARDLPSLTELWLAPDAPEAPEEVKRRYGLRHTLQYAGEISYMDREIGRLLDALRSRRIVDDALVVVTSDHGETFWEHADVFDHGHAVYQTTIHAVCTIRLPFGASGGARIGEPVASIDVLPTLLGLLGVAVPPGCDGVRLPLEGGPEREPRRAIFLQATKPTLDAEHEERWPNARKARAIREGPFKLVQTPYMGTEELYDLSADPGETRDLLRKPAAAQRAVALRLRGELSAWAAAADPLPSSPEGQHSQDTLERLRSLGYLN